MQTHTAPTNALQFAEGLPAAAVSLDTARLMQASIAPNTRIAYESALRRFAEHLQGRSPTDALLADYLSLLHGHGLAPASIAVVVQAVRFVEKLEDQPTCYGPLSRRTLAGIRREGNDRGRGQVAALRARDVERMACTRELADTLAGYRDVALFRLMSDCLLRISEAVACNVEHLSFEEDATGLLFIPKSKTDQEGDGAYLAFGPPTTQALRRLIDRGQLSTGPLFRRILKGDTPTTDRLTARGARNAIKDAAQAAGIDGASGHSLRIGTAQDVAQAGATLVELQNAGRWTDTKMPGHYTRQQAAAQGAVLKYRYGKLSELISRPASTEAAQCRDRTSAGGSFISAWLGADRDRIGLSRPPQARRR